jgi:pyrimidine-specific ribonucleoside hydrolase
MSACPPILARSALPALVLASALACTALPAVAARPHKAAAAPGTGAAATRVIIDTDMAIDDWAAMLYLLQHPQVQVLGVTVTGAGEAHCQPGAQHAVDLVDISAQKGVPVACGDAEPMDGYVDFPAEWRKGADTFYDVAVPAAKRAPDKRHAAQLLIDLLQKSNGKVKLVVIGNATNVAQALLKRPGIKNKIERIYMMAGAVWAKGNIIVPGFTDHYKNKTSEWNVLIDPVATRIVLQSGVPVTLVPLDGTNDVKVTPADALAFKQAAQTPGGRFYSQILDKNSGFIDSGEYYFWDVLTAAVALHPEYCRYQTLPMDVVIGYSDKTNGNPLPGFSAKRWDGKPRRNFDPYYTGQTIISDKGRQVQVCVGANATQFKADLLQTLNRQPAP